MTLAAGTRLGSYEVLSPLGAGGMGEVYRARDKKLDRDVAVKVLPQSLAKDADALTRFEREAKAVAALSHPNILAIHDFGTQEGTAYAVTELLEGDTLRGKLDGGAISQKNALDWSLQVARGLSAAHGKGVVHRDLKPENVFVCNDGHVKILDFGLAKRVGMVGPDEQTIEQAGSGQTEAGTVMGTMGYMSPEQLRGLPVDHRTDIFSFGAILYELLSGRKAFKRDTASDTIAAVLREEPPELTSTGRNVSPALDHIVHHCLEKDRENRFQTAKDVAFALSEASAPTTTITSGVQIVRDEPRRKWKPLAIAGIALVVLAAAGLLLWKRPRAGASSASAGVKRIAVLPFENLGAPADDYFADGIADQIRGKLTGLPGVEVIARGSSTPYRKTTKTPQEIAKELSANYLLTATVRWQKDGGANRVQVNPELVEIRADGPPASRWQQPFDAALTDVFRVQSDIATRVAQSLGVALAPKEEKALAERPTDNVAAYDAFLKGEEASSSLARTEPASIRRALTFYESAVSLDPRFAQAWAQISVANTLLYTNSVPDRALEARAREAAEKAIDLAPNRGEGYGALAAYYRLAAADPSRSLEQYDKALQLAPGSIDLLRGRGATEAVLGRWDDALRDMREAARRDPRSIPNASTLSDTLMRMGRRDEARPMVRHLVEVDPKNVTRLERYAMLYLGDGDLDGARRVVADGAARIELPAMVAYFATYNDLVWVLDGKQLELLRTLTPAAFDDDPATWALVQAQAGALAGDAAGVREFATKAVVAFDQQLAASPDDAQLHALRGLALAYAGRKDEALREAERGLALRGPEKDAVTGPYFLYTLARVYTLNGETDKAIETLERLIRLPNYVTPGWARIDPNFATLRGTPRFQKLVAAAK